MNNPLSVKLLPCPWCKHKKPRLFAWNAVTHYGECMRSECRASGPLGATPEEAAQKWNGMVGRP